MLKKGEEDWYMSQWSSKLRRGILSQPTGAQGGRRRWKPVVWAHGRARWQKAVEVSSRQQVTVDGGQSRTELVKVDEEGGPG